jgi:hypothetical protein
MEGGGLDRRRFMEEIRAYTTDIVEKAKNFQGDTIEGNFEDIDVTCPACKTGTIHDTGTAWQCSNVGKCKFRMGKSLASKLKKSSLRPLHLCGPHRRRGFQIRRCRDRFALGLQLTHQFGGH